MYAPFFGLKQEPFSIAPDPRYLFMSERHREALAHLLYGVRGGGGFVLLTGEIGAGKTTVCRCFLEQIPKRCNVAYIFNPKLTVFELLKTVCEEFRIPYQHQGPGAPTVKDYLDPLNDFLLRTHAIGLNNVLIIDEAQNLSPDVLEQLRLLTNLETTERKLLQIILIGQPELRDMLARPQLEQLAQRVIARYHLKALSEKETSQYIRHRMAVAGMRTALPFDRPARHRIFQLSRGVPRRINLLCDRALLGAYGQGQPRVDEAIVDKAAAEVFGSAHDDDATLPAGSRFAHAARWGLGAAGAAALLGMVAWAVDGRLGRPSNGTPDAQASQFPASAASSPDKARPAVAAASAATPAAPPASAVSLDLRDGLKTAWRTEKEAWRELAPAWKLAADLPDPCASAQRENLLCFRTVATLALIRQLSRPGILLLRDDAGQSVFVLLTALTPQTATLRAGGVSQTVSLLSLAKVWRGDFATFWRAPEGYQSALSEGSGGPVVEALATLVARADGASAPSGASSFNAALKSRLAAFQVAWGLSADGVAGPTTFMQLNRAAGVDEPRLQADAGLVH
ncbi:AAA family ATPase [Rhizobacter sp. SG703]|uniref:AAA family ATPase n=1 Tax=Rhizobacter sp. SG703 TaxID=2587140 RepID=UPI001446F6ED|nr:AAA family ATPase [Rhizobacter sp. SG703]NKI92864.1 general secretion pathway protein A [Rhizobacter sp. SG703]